MGASGADSGAASGGHPARLLRYHRPVSMKVRARRVGAKAREWCSDLWSAVGMWATGASEMEATFIPVRFRAGIWMMDGPTIWLRGKA